MKSGSESRTKFENDEKGILTIPQFNVFIVAAVVCLRSDVNENVALDCINTYQGTTASFIPTIFH